MNQLVYDLKFLKDVESLFVRQGITLLPLPDLEIDYRSPYLTSLVVASKDMNIVIKLFSSTDDANELSMRFFSRELDKATTEEQAFEVFKEVVNFLGGVTKRFVSVCSPAPGTSLPISHYSLDHVFSTFRTDDKIRFSFLLYFFKDNVTEF